MTKGIETTVAVANIKDTLHVDVAAAALEKVQRVSACDYLALLEWPGDRRTVLEDLARRTRFRWDRPAEGGSPVLWDSGRAELLSLRSRVLAPSGFVGRLIGRRSTLPPSRCTVAVFEDDLLGEVTLLVAHLTADVDTGPGKYKTSRQFLLRVVRHRLERYRLGAVARRHRRKGRTVFTVVDSNFHLMTLRGLVSCWTGRDPVGTHGWRTIDIVYGPTRATKVQTIPTPSDHHAVAATYQEDKA